MNREDIIRMAREAGLEFDDSCTLESTPIWYVNTDELERFAALVAAAEREACAQLCDHLWESKAAGAYECATAIRARGQ